MASYSQSYRQTFPQTFSQSRLDGVSGVSGGGPAVPVNSVAPAISGTRFVGYTLTSTTGTWSNSPTSYAYQWRRGGSNISGATSSTYELVDADIGASITCRVTASNGDGAGSPATSNAIDPILKVTGGTITEAGGNRIHTITTSGDFVLSGGSLDIEYLFAPSGGGGGKSGSGGAGGGGGAGRFITNVGGTPLTLSAGTYAVVVGAPGSGSTVASTAGTNGNDLTAFSITGTGGGAGGGSMSAGTLATVGGSGGGGGATASGGKSGASDVGGVGSGNAGGASDRAAGGGGGGAGAVGGVAVFNAEGGNGGDGLASSITGSSVDYCGGGGGGSRNSTGGTASFGGGAGGSGAAGNGSNGAKGGGGGGASGTGNGGNGGAAELIVRYPL